MIAMTIRNALHQSAIVTFGVAIAALWLLVAWFQVLDTVSLAGVGAVGTGTTAGVLGLLVLAVTLGLLLVVAGELGQSSPAPNSWPPTE